MRRLGKAGRAGIGAPGGPLGGAVPGGHWAASASLLATAAGQGPRRLRTPTAFMSVVGRELQFGSAAGG